jgi:hypothetical protein
VWVLYHSDKTLYGLYARYSTLHMAAKRHFRSLIREPSRRTLSAYAILSEPYAR